MSKRNKQKPKDVLPDNRLRKDFEPILTLQYLSWLALSSPFVCRECCTHFPLFTEGGEANRKPKMSNLKREIETKFWTNTNPLAPSQLAYSSTHHSFTAELVSGVFSFWLVEGIDPRIFRSPACWGCSCCICCCWICCWICCCCCCRCSWCCWSWCCCLWEWIWSCWNCCAVKRVCMAWLFV